MPRKRGKAGSAHEVREPLQVYLTTGERETLDRLARQAGISRAEVLRRGLKSFAAEQQAEDSPMLRWIEKYGNIEVPPDLATRADDYLIEAYLDTHDQ